MQILHNTSNIALSQKACAGSLLEILPGLMRYVRRQMRSRRAKGLSVPQFRTLVQLRRFPAVSLSHISEALGSTAPTASRIVSGLVAKGLVVRKTASHDRRQVSLHLTTRGQELIDRAWAGTQEVLAEKLSGLSLKQMTELARALALLNSIFPAGGPDDSGGMMTP